MKDFSQKALSVKGTINRLSFFAVAAFFVLMTSASAFGQIVEFANTFSGAPASINATTVDPNLNSPVTLSRGAGLTAASSTVRFSSTSFASGTALNLANNDYYTFTVTAKPGFVINLNSQAISITLSATAAGPQSYALFTSVGGFTDVSQQVGTTLVNGSNTVTLPATGYNGLTSIEFRIYGFNASSGSGTGGPSFISLNGSVTAVAATPGTIQFNPTTYNPGEGAGSVMLTVTRTGGTDGAISATYTINNGSATGGTCPNADFDNSGSGGTVNFAAGSSTSQVITIPICNDGVVESDEAFTVVLTGTNVSATNATATVNITDPPTTAASVSVGGRVTDSKGRGISRALVTMTDGNGNNYSAYTDSSGYYLFEEVEVGQTLIFDVKAKRYNFTQPTQVVSLTEEIVTVNFTGYESRRSIKF